MLLVGSSSSRSVREGIASSGRSSLSRMVILFCVSKLFRVHANSFSLSVLLAKRKRLGVAPSTWSLYMISWTSVSAILFGQLVDRITLTLTHLSFKCSYGIDLKFCPPAFEFEAVKLEKVVVDGEEREKTTKCKHRGLRFVGMKMQPKKMLSKVIDIEKNYIFRPYSYTPREILPLQLYLEVSKEISIVPKAKSPLGLCFYYLWFLLHFFLQS